MLSDLSEESLLASLLLPFLLALCLEQLVSLLYPSRSFVLAPFHQLVHFLSTLVGSYQLLLSLPLNLNLLEVLLEIVQFVR